MTCKYCTLLYTTSSYWVIISHATDKEETGNNEQTSLQTLLTVRGTADNEQISEREEGGQTQVRGAVTVETDYGFDDDQDESSYSDTDEPSIVMTVTVMTRRQAAKLKRHNDNNNVVTDSANKRGQASADEQTDQT